jgi:addiction module RelE/StbE family toxin
VKLSIRKAADAELARIYQWIAKDSPVNAASVIDRILDAIEFTIPQYPLIGRSGKTAGTRELVVSGLPYIVVYEIDFPRDLVTILSVRHGAQRR